MDTITIESTQVGVPNVSYTSAEVLRFIEKAKDYDNANLNLATAYKDIRSIKEKVRDFFSEVEWEDGEQTVSKSDVNELLESIGSHKLTTTYRGTFTINGTFEVEAEDEDEASSVFVDNASVDFSEGDYRIEDISTDDVCENYQTWRVTPSTSGIDRHLCYDEQVRGGRVSALSLFLPL